MDIMTAEIKKFIDKQPDYNGDGRYAIHGSSHEGWSLSYHRFGGIKKVYYRFMLNDKGVPFDYQRL